MLTSINGGKEVRPSCVNVYLNRFSQDEKIITKKKVSRKNVLCIASENPLMYTTSYLMITEASNLIEGIIPQYNPGNTKIWYIWIPKIGCYDARFI